MEQKKNLQKLKQNQSQSQKLFCPILVVTKTLCLLFRARLSFSVMLCSNSGLHTFTPGGCAVQLESYLLATEQLHWNSWQFRALLKGMSVTTSFFFFTFSGNVFKISHC